MDDNQPSQSTTALCAKRRFAAPRLAGLPALRQCAAGLEVAGSLVLAIVLLRSAVANLGNPYYFLTSIYQYELVPPRVGQFAAMVLPMLQVLVGICLIGRVVLGPALTLGCGLFALFVFVQSWALYHGLKMPCGCFGASSDTIDWHSVLQVSGLLGLAAITAIAFFLRTTPADETAN